MVFLILTEFRAIPLPTVTRRTAGLGWARILPESSTFYWRFSVLTARENDLGSFRKKFLVPKSHPTHL